MMPSPRFFTSVPSVAASAWRSREKWFCLSMSASSGLRREDSSVDPTMSVKRMVTVWVFAKGAPEPIPVTEC